MNHTSMAAHLSCFCTPCITRLEIHWKVCQETGLFLPEDSKELWSSLSDEKKLHKPEIFILIIKLVIFMPPHVNFGPSTTTEKLF